MIRFIARAVAALVLTAALPAIPSGASADTTGSLDRLYCAYFDRAPDRAGLRYWQSVAAGGLTLSGISENFAGSQEFRLLYGNTTNSDFVARLYINVMKRDLDPEGAAYWLLRLDDGTLGRGELMVLFSDSEEYRQTVYPAQTRCIPPADPSGTTGLRGVLTQLQVAPETNFDYDRDVYDQNSAATRRATIERDSRDGMIYSPYDGLTLPCTVSFCPADAGSNSVQKDHVVALNEAHDSGAWAWSESRKVEFSTDLANLRMVSGAANGVKGARDPAEWLPTNGNGAICDYLGVYLRIKLKYSLTMDAAEHAAVSATIDTAGCDG